MNWLKTELLTGFQKLLCLGLDRTPASEVIPGTVEAWLEAVTANRLWDQDRDTSRIRQAFVTLARTRRLWPAPVDFLEALPTIRQELLPPPRAKADPAKVAAIDADIRRVLGIGR
jgi:hypothetical protein